jgi:hypothetical protein
VPGGPAPRCTKVRGINLGNPEQAKIKFGEGSRAGASAAPAPRADAEHFDTGSPDPDGIADLFSSGWPLDESGAGSAIGSLGCAPLEIVASSG